MSLADFALREYRRKKEGQKEGPLAPADTIPMADAVTAERPVSPLAQRALQLYQEKSRPQVSPFEPQAVSPEPFAITPEAAEPSTTAMRTTTPTIRPPVSRPPVQPGIPGPTPYMPGLVGKEAFPAFPDLSGLSGGAPVPLPEFQPPSEPSIIRKGLEVARRAPFAFGAVSPERYEKIIGNLRERQQKEAITTRQRQYWRDLYAGGKAGPLDTGLAIYQAFWHGLTGTGNPDLMQEAQRTYPRQNIAGNIMGTLFGFYLAGGVPVPGLGKLQHLVKTPWVSRLVYNTTRSAKTIGLRDFVTSLGREVTKGQGVDAKKVFKETTDGVMWGIILGMSETARGPVREFLTHKRVIEELPAFKRTLDKKYVQHLFTGEGSEEQWLIAKTLGPEKWKSAVKATRMGKEFEFAIPPRQVITWMDRGYYAQLKKILGLERYVSKGTPTLKGEPSLKTTKEPLAWGFKKTIEVPKGARFAPGEVVPEAKIIGGAAAPTPTFGLTPETARARPPSAKVIQEKLGLGVQPKVPERRAAKPPVTEAEIARAEREKAEGLFGPGRGKAAEQLRIAPGAKVTPDTPAGTTVRIPDGRTGILNRPPASKYAWVRFPSKKEGVEFDLKSYRNTELEVVGKAQAVVRPEPERTLEGRISEFETAIIEAGGPLHISFVQSAASGLSDKQYLEALKEITPKASELTTTQVENIMARHKAEVAEGKPGLTPALDITKYEERLERARGELRRIKEYPARFTDAEYGKQTKEWEGRIADIEDDIRKLKAGTHPAQIEAAEKREAVVRAKPTPEPSMPMISDKAQAKADRLRKLAKTLDKQIEAKEHPAIADQPLTVRRARIAAGMSADADHLRQIQGKLNAVADGIEKLTLPKSLRGIKSKSQVEFLQNAAKYEHKYPKHKPGEYQHFKESVDKDLRALDKMGITNEQVFEEAKKDLMELKTELIPSETAKELKIRHMEADLLGRKIPGFFPTPRPLAEKMIEIADISAGMSVLEPSAGAGHLADVIKEAVPDAKLETVEINSELRKILEVKKHKIVGTDILEYKGKRQYDRIMMNPPYEKGQDMRHVRHAYNLLVPEGKLVALMGEGAFFRTDKNAVAFRDWLKKVNADVEKLPEKSFVGKEAFRQTGVAARIVTIEKPLITKPAVHPVLTTSTWGDVESAVARYGKRGIALRIETQVTPQGKLWKVYEKTPAELRGEAPGKKTVKVRVGRKVLDIPERRLAEVKGIRDRIQEIIDIRVEGYIREAMSAPKAGRYPLADTEIEVRGSREWTGQKSIRPEITKGVSTAKLKDALERKGKSGLWREYRDVVRDELEYGGESFEGRAFPPDEEFLRLIAKAEARAMMPPEARMIPGHIDVLEREIAELQRAKTVELQAASLEGRDPELGQYLGPINKKEAELLWFKRKMGGTSPEDWEVEKRGIERYAVLDKTGVYEDTAFRGILKDEVKKAKIAGVPLSVIYSDMDNFKHINDTFGHDKGDEVLKQYAGILKKITGVRGAAGRAGKASDEFMAVLPGVDAQKIARISYAVANRLKQKGLAGLKEGTASIGVATLGKRDGETVQELLKTAERNMMRAKAEGGARAFNSADAKAGQTDEAEALVTKHAAEKVLKGKPIVTEEQLERIHQTRVKEIIAEKPNIGNATANVLSRISTTPEKEKIPFAGKIEGIYRMTVDELYPLKKYTEVLKKKGVKVLAEDDPFILASQHRGWHGKADTYLHHKTFDVNFNWTGKSLTEIYKPVNSLRALDEFDAYLISKAILGRKFVERGIKTGINPKDAHGAIKELERKYPQFQGVAKDLYEYQDQLLKYMFDSQLIDKDAFQNMKRLNKQYVPFYRVMELAQGQGLLGKGVVNLPKVLKRIKGSGREIISPSESIVKNTYTMIDAAERNQVGLAITRLAKASPEDYAGFIQKVPPKIARVAQVSMKEIEAKLKEELGLSPDLAESVVNIFRPSILTPRANIITVMEKGKRTFYEVDPDLYKSLTALDRETINALIKILSVPARMLRLGATTLCAEFLVRNPARDAFTAFVYSKYGFIPGFDSWRGLFSLFKKDELYWRWKMSGGEHSMLVSLDRAYLQKGLKEVMAGKGQQLKNVIKHPVENTAILSELGEAMTRLGEFKLGFGGGKRWFLMADRIPKGTPLRSRVLEAGNSSREVTLDFQRLGAMTRAVNMVIAFWNANVQDLDKIRRSFIEYPERTLMKALLGITLPSILLHEAQKDNPRYKELPRWQKDLFWIFVIPNGPILRIPMPFTMGILFGRVPVSIIEYIETEDPAIFKNLTESILKSVSPGVLPTAFQSPIEVGTNYNMFLDRPVVPRSKQKLPPELQYTIYTPETAKLIGKTFGVSPLKVQHFIRGYTGGFGTLAMETTDQILKSIDTGEKPVKPQRTLADVPVVRGFIAREPIGSASESFHRFYEVYERAMMGESAVKEMVRQEDLKGLRKYYLEYPECEHIKALKIAAKVLAEQAKLRLEVWESKTLSSKEKRRQITIIDRKRTQLARGALRLVKGESQKGKKKEIEW